jgi:hypothetical protein
MKPENVHRMLHNATYWFAIKKGTTQSYTEAIRSGIYDKLQTDKNIIYEYHGCYAMFIMTNF